ncbi:hypothetical protein [Streptomyces sp. NBC_00120]|uniref:hypothetical protein n=1 Tax=Streptomyces sp. NBC_00120 TaxID=2975660 RepID=UPI002252B993|nr:hypothetical protein [Streptomyces sp. NBC_00120]MCX5326285.1 hypothetical protein [Streptomyces sp. NBC_00120]
MGCACKNKREQWEVISAAGKVLFTSGSEPTANAVSRRYTGSTVQKKDKSGKVSS